MNPPGLRAISLRDFRQIRGERTLTIRELNVVATADSEVIDLAN
jgi:hypothetical protein